MSPERLFRGIKDYLARDRRNNQVSVYCHIPFCKRRCAFCDLYTLSLNRENRPLFEQYVHSLVKEIGLWKGIVARRTVTTIHFGGGTPSCIPADDMHRILQALRHSFPITDETEIAIEMASRDLTREYRLFLHREKARRIHVGVQSLDDRIRKEMGRVDPAEKLLEKIQSTLQEGFILSVDLIFGLPGQSLDSFLADLSTLIGTGVHGFSLYELQIPGNNPLGVDKIKDFLRDRRLNYAMFCEGKKRLEDSGYEQNFFVHFSRSLDKNLYCTYPSRNEEGIALGTLADGKAGPWFFTNAPFHEYARQLSNGQTPIGNGYKMSGEEMMVQKVEIGLLGTMLRTSVLSSITDNLRHEFSELSSHWESAGLVEKTDDGQSLRVTGKGCWFMGNMIEQLRHDLLKGRNVVGRTRQRSPDLSGE